MNLLKIFESRVKFEVYHATNNHFTKFLPKPTWFSLNKKDAKGWHHSGFATTATYICEFIGCIATEQEAEKIAKQIWPESNFLYSMYDASIGEYDKDEIKQFISLLENSGYEAAYIKDYDPANFNKGSSRSLCVFRPDLHVKIKGEISSFSTITGSDIK